MLRGARLVLEDVVLVVLVGDGNLGVGERDMNTANGCEHANGCVRANGHETDDGTNIFDINNTCFTFSVYGTGGAYDIKYLFHFLCLRHGRCV